MVLGEPRDKIKQDAVIESVYDPEAEKRLEQHEIESEKKHGKGLIRIFGYKHVKSMKFFGQLLKCLKDCYDYKFEQLNIDLNFFLLLKNELSLHFLRSTENVAQALKNAVRIYASKDEATRKNEEAQEL